ncbi:MAG: HIT domain-containing protein [Chlamydiia bacterium]|nr:HIT domain-containing protein [Chlamydiia bacterium]
MDIQSEIVHSTRLSHIISAQDPLENPQQGLIAHEPERQLRASTSQRLVKSLDSIAIQLPEKPLAAKSLQVTTQTHKPYREWSKLDRSNSYSALQKITAVWRKTGVADQYLIYENQHSDDRSFTWEVIPYRSTSTCISRLWQQLLVLWKVIFGGSVPAESQQLSELDETRPLFLDFDTSTQRTHQVNDEQAGNDAFCQREVIAQQVVLEGKLVNVLYNYAPIGFGGERLHFLIVPTAHRTDFGTLSRDEYLEATDLAQKLMGHFSETRPIENCYLYHKTGADAGQTVLHWHLHLILTSSKSQDVFGKLTVLKNMIIGSSPISREELADRVRGFREEFEGIQNSSNLTSPTFVI